MHIDGTTTGGGTVTIDMSASGGGFAQSVINNALSISTMATVDGHALLRIERL